MSYSLSVSRISVSEIEIKITSPVILRLSIEEGEELISRLKSGDRCPFKRLKKFLTRIEDVSVEENDRRELISSLEKITAEENIS